MGILHDLEINDGFFFMLALYLATFVVVYFVALRGLIAGLVERHSRIDGRAKTAAHLKTELSEIQTRLASELRRVRNEANESFFKLRAKATADQRTLLTEAREKTAQQIKQVRNEVTEKMAQESKKLEQEIPNLAKMILEQILSGTSSKSRTSATELRK